MPSHSYRSFLLTAIFKHFTFNWRAGASQPSRSTGAVLLYTYIFLCSWPRATRKRKAGSITSGKTAKGMSCASVCYNPASALVL